MRVAGRAEGDTGLVRGHEVRELPRTSDRRATEGRTTSQARGVVQERQGGVAEVSEGEEVRARLSSCVVEF